MRISMLGQPYKIESIRSTLRWQPSPPDSEEGPGTQYHVDLNGKADRNWSKTFHLVQWDCFESFTYRLAAGGTAITFHCSPEEGPARAEVLLMGLEALVKIVNASASRRPEEFLLPVGQMHGRELANA